MKTSNAKKFRRFPGIQLRNADRKAVAAMLNKGTWPARILKRARVLQLLDQQWRVTDIMHATGVYPATIRKLGYRYRDGGLDMALQERPRPGAQQLLDDSSKAQVVAMVCGSPPAGRARWSIRLATQEAVERGIVATVGRETIRRALLEHDLKPWRKKNVVRS